MSDPYSRVAPGEKLKIPARAWNQLMDSLATVPSMIAGAGEQYHSPYMWVYAKNTTGQAVPRWGVLAVTGMESTPTATTTPATRQFEEMPILTGGSTGETGSPVCVAVEPIPAGRIGRVAVSGAVQLRASDVAKVSHAHMLYENNDWALVVLGGGGVRLGTISATWAKGTTSTVTQLRPDGSAMTPTRTFTATNWFAAVTVSSGTKKVACASVGSQWILIAAECS